MNQSLSGIPGERVKPTTPPNSAINSQKSARNRQFSGELLTVPQAAKLLDMSERTLRLWCELGKVAALPQQYGNKTSYLISVQAIELLRNQRIRRDAIKNRNSKTPFKPHNELIDPWKKAMERGTLNGKPYSLCTITDYHRYIVDFISKHKTLSTKALKTEFTRIPVSQYWKRFNLYKAVVCFGKFLIQEEQLDKAFLEDVKPFWPKRHTSPRRTVATAEEVQAMINETDTPMNGALVVLLASTGLRSSECCGIQRQDVDYMKQTLTVRRGKGGKSRLVGLNQMTIAALIQYEESLSRARKPNEPFFVHQGKPLTRHGLHKRIELIGKKAGIKVSPHSLRRAFVTINAGKGRPLAYLQRACGHSDIRTTMSYCLTSEQEVIDAMKEW